MFMGMLRWLAQTTQTQRVKSRLLNDPFYRFQTLAELQMAAELGIQIDANRASVDDWLRLPGLSIHQARALVELTQAGVLLHSLEDVAAAIQMPLTRVQPWQAVLKFCYYDADSVYSRQPVDVNQASADLLARIPGIDWPLARAIVAQREAGPYRNLSHLQRRLSLSAEQTGKLLHYLKF
jgi:DNA uptake protein ComE-like DNA-binding protein